MNDLFVKKESTTQTLIKKLGDMIPFPFVKTAFDIILGVYNYRSDL
jgi:hypothetical protein